MSVLIKDMEMPNECGECDIYVCYRTWNGDPGDEFCGITKENVSYKTKPDWCPLSETSEPEKGEWIPSFNGEFTGGAYWFHCPECNRIVPDVRNGGWNFCPNCGKPME